MGGLSNVVELPIRLHHAQHFAASTLHGADDYYHINRDSHRDCLVVLLLGEEQEVALAAAKDATAHANSGGVEHSDGLTNEVLQERVIISLSHE